MIRVCVAGVTGWAGKAVADAIGSAPDLELVSGVSRSAAGSGNTYANVAEALDAIPADVLVDFTSAETVRDNVLTALRRGVRVVNGSSGLTAEDYTEIEAVATEKGLGVVAMANASILAALMQRFAVQAAELLPSWEIIDYASAEKIDAPSGTSRQLAERLGSVRAPSLSKPIDQVIGPREARGASVAGTQVHSLRLPSYSVSTEVIFGLPGERLTIRHEAGESAAPYVAGTLLAIRAVVKRVGLIRGLDALLFP
ncbi:MAG TPA: 4-hydroxy-tetrahydrodipicolinate reductase [Candidatus Dormibacteraeota bacterium]|nr:4-hydroxy-tetrahydrodipicolinate reductase [Candidatus Dormibacteraeota bacterium]